MSRLVIMGGLVADLAAGTAEARDLVIEDGRIAAILAPGTAGMAGAEHRDARDRLILPGLVNSHTHGHANLVKGVADRWIEIPAAGQDEDALEFPAPAINLLPKK